MLLKLLPAQIPTYQDVIVQAIDESMPGYSEQIRTALFRDLLLDECQAWLSYTDDESFEGVLITQLRKDIGIGINTLTIVCLYTPNALDNTSFIRGWPLIQKYAKSKGCTAIDFYTDNQAVLKYVKLFNVILDTRYIQISLEDKEI